MLLHCMDGRMEGFGEDSVAWAAGSGLSQSPGGGETRRACRPEDSRIQEGKQWQDDSGRDFGASNGEGFLCRNQQKKSLKQPPAWPARDVNHCSIHFVDFMRGQGPPSSGSKLSSCHLPRMQGIFFSCHLQDLEASFPHATLLCTAPHAVRGSRASARGAA